jgi:hypothetical protein
MAGVELLDPDDIDPARRQFMEDGAAGRSNPDNRHIASFAQWSLSGPDVQSSGSTLTMEAPSLLPTQKVTGVVELSTKTRRMLVGRGNR